MHLPPFSQSPYRVGSGVSLSICSELGTFFFEFLMFSTSIFFRFLIFFLFIIKNNLIILFQISNVSHTSSIYKHSLSQTISHVFFGNQ